MKVYRFPAGIFEIDEQLLVPERTTIAGAADPNDMQRPTESPDWQRQTLFLATRGASNYSMNYCHAKDMVTTRVGFVLSSHCTIGSRAYPHREGKRSDTFDTKLRRSGGRRKHQHACFLRGSCSSTTHVVIG